MKREINDLTDIHDASIAIAKPVMAPVIPAVIVTKKVRMLADHDFLVASILKYFII